jgi:hypothetical protein
VRRGRISVVAGRLGLPVALSAGAYLFLSQVHAHYPIEKWLFWRYAAYVLLCGFFFTACVAAGHVVLLGVLRLRASLFEHLALSFAVGVLVFFLGTFLAGLLGLLGRWFAVLWPSALALGGLPSLIAHLHRYRVLWRSRTLPRRRSALSMALVGFGILSFVMVYFAVITPTNVGYDARWYHLPIAEHYAAAGAVVPFPEGWYQGTLPHLTSFIYLWAHLLPRMEPFDRVMLSSHLELTMILGTLLAISATTRGLVPGAGVALGWVAYFLFQIQVLPSNISTAADNVAAFWALPIWLSFRRAWRTIRVRDAVLLGAMMAGAVLTKYQALSIVVFPALAIAARFGWLTIFPAALAPRRTAAKALAAVPLAMLVFSAPHWLKNLIWYGDPVYPMLHRHLQSTAWSADAAKLHEHVFAANLWQPSGTAAEKALATLDVLFTFAFKPHDWAHFNPNLPLFGSLFTLGLLAVPFLGRRPELWAICGASLCGVGTWFWLSHQDRYLIAVVPWMASAVAAIVVLAWRRGTTSKLAVSGLVAGQAIWGFGASLLPIHPTIHQSVQKLGIDLINSGHAKDYERRLSIFEPFPEIGKHVGRDAVLLVHQFENKAGLNRRTVSDWWQGGISYGQLATPRRVYEALRSYGVTHLLWETAKRSHVDSLAGHLVFADFALNHTDEHRLFGGPFGSFSVSRMRDRAPDDGAGAEQRLVAYAGCGATYDPGLYQLRDLTVIELGRWTKADFPKPRAALEKAAEIEPWFVALDHGCHAPFARLIRGERYERMGRTGPLEIWVRKATSPGR